MSRILIKERTVNMDPVQAIFSFIFLIVLIIFCLNIVWSAYPERGKEMDI
jgi:cbb3-type cytochrome oxidase subunit 3